MNIIDLHCDVLWKIWESRGRVDFQHSPELDCNRERMRKGQIKVQCFAIFVPPEVKEEAKFQAALDQVDYFYTEVLRKHNGMKLIRKWPDLYKLKEHETGAILSLEGADSIGSDLQKLRVLHRLGVRLVGLTWNNANLAADGIEEPRGAGLTAFGKEVVHFNNQHLLFTDVSHLSERSFWDVMELAEYPLASHSNARAVCGHPRNLTDEQAKTLFRKNAMIHVVFYADFTAAKEKVHLSDLIRHIDHFCSLGGERHIGFGSDFDGIDRHIIDLENASKYQNLINELLKYYSEDQVKGFAWRNFLDHLPKINNL
jgi:membrane dipeptidase